GQAIELVQDDLREDVLLQLDDDAQALAIALVAHLGDALDALVLDALGDLRDEARLVDLVGDLGDDDLLAVALERLLLRRFAAHRDRAATELVSLFDTDLAVDDAARRKVWSGHHEHELVDGEGRVFDERDRRVDDLADVVRRDVRRHAYGNAARAVHEQ